MTDATRKPAEATGMACLQNTLQVGDDGWAMLAPYGDFPGVASLTGADGRVSRSRVVQRISREAATEMVNAFQSVTGRIRRFLRGVPIYVGHPDAPGIGDRWADKSPKGTIADLEARDTGLFCRPVFTNEGIEYLDAHGGLGFSARWTATPAGEADGQPVFTPRRLLSAGLTDNPNLPVELLNEAAGATQPLNPRMDRSKLILALAGLGLTLANDAGDDQIATALAGLKPRLDAGTTLANEKPTLVAERDRLQTEVNTLTQDRNRLRTEVANERAGRIDLALDKAVVEGRIPHAEREAWKGKLTADFANEAQALGKLAPRLKTVSQIGAVGERKAELANCQDFGGAVNHFMRAGKPKAEAVRLAMAAAPDLYAAYRESGGAI